MSYNKKNILQRIIDIQNIVLENRKKGVTQKWIYHHIIFPQYKISYSSYNGYLAFNAKKELKILHEKQEEQEKTEGMQFNLFDTETKNPAN